MVVRIRITRNPRFDGVFAGIASLLTLLAVACFVLGTWKLFSTLGWAGSFVVTSGFFSHWQIWMGVGILSQLISFRLTRRFASL